MVAKIRNRNFYPVLLLALLLSLLVFTVTYASVFNIDNTNKWAYGTNIGWLNFKDSNGGMQVFSDHLEGYVWAENVGWIRLGTYESGGTHTYANDAAGTYGINNDGCGNLSGYAWGTNIGWVNFNPSDSQVTIDPLTGDFDGYAWAENVGWIHFKNTTGTAYKVNTTDMGNLAYHTTGKAALLTGGAGSASSSGLNIDNAAAFLTAAGDCIVFGHNNTTFENVTENLPPSNGVNVEKRWARIWELDVNDADTAGGNVDLTFDISDAGGTGNFSDTGTYYLLKRAAGSADDFAVVNVEGTSVSGDQLTFTVDAADLGSEFTLGATLNSPTVITLNHFGARSIRGLIGIALIPLLLVVSGVLFVVRKRKFRRSLR